MNKNIKKERPIKHDLIDADLPRDERRTEENIEKSVSSNISSRFEKKHGRTNQSLGIGHEPGTLPGTGV